MTLHTVAPPHRAPDIFAVKARLGCGVNLGNALDAPSYEGQFGMRLEARYFRLIAQAGFDSVRIPICWSAHADAHPPYTIDPAFIERVDWALTQAKRNDLAAVINVHHYHELNTDPCGHRERYLALWRQIAERFQDEPPTILFELFNEPKDALTVDGWNELLPLALAEVRRANPTRAVIIGPAHWNSIQYVDTLLLPDDPNLIVTFHYYQPFRFTHQGAGWVAGAQEWLGTTWEGNKFERLAITALFDKALAWARQVNRPLYMGEFGAYKKANLAEREQWTRTVAQNARKRGISLAYWEFGFDFGLYNRRLRRWNRGLLDAVLGRPPHPPGRLTTLWSRLKRR